MVIIRYLDQVQKKKMIQGRFINQTDIDENRKVVVISEEIYKQLFEKDAEMIGEYIQLNGMNFKVVGMFETEMVIWGHQRYAYSVYNLSANL